VVTVGDPAVVVDEEAQRVDVVFRARLAPGQHADGIRPSSPEILEAGWFHLDALPDLQFETSGALMAIARRSIAPHAD